MLETRAIPGDRGSGVIAINGAPAHLVRVGDLVILIPYAQMDDATVHGYRPRVGHVDLADKIIQWGADRPRPYPA